MASSLPQHIGGPSPPARLAFHFVAPTSTELELPTLPPTSNPALNGWRAPVRSEFTSKGPFTLNGSLPRGLEGRFLWLGSNPVVVNDPETYDPVDGDGMLHSLEIRDGQPTEQRSRRVVTRHLVDLLGARAPEGPLAAAGPLANLQLVEVARRLLALDGRGLGYRITPDLRTACVEDFDATLASPMGTQVVTDPSSGDALFLGVDPQGPPWLRLHRLSPSGSITETTVVEVPSWRAEPALGATETRAVLAESSLIAPPLRGDDDEVGRLQFDPGHAPRIGLLDHGADGSRMHWSVSEPGHVSSIAAAEDFSLGVRLVVLRSSPDRIDDPTWWPTRDRGYLEHIEVNDLGHAAAIRRLDDLKLRSVMGDPACTFPTRRFLYALTSKRSGSKGAMLVKYDLATGHAERRIIAEHEVADSPFFVRDPEGTTDEEGWVVVPIFDRTTETSQLMILDGTRFSGAAESVVSLPERMPIGLTGLFLSPHSYR